MSVDAMAVYRGFDVGTDKPSPSSAPWHLLDLADPDEEFSVASFQRAAREAIEGIHERGNRAVLVGGTGLYHRAVLDGLRLPGRYPAVEADLRRRVGAGGLGALYELLVRLDPAAAARIEPSNERRLVRALEVTIGSGRPFSAFGEGLAQYQPSAATIAGLTLDRAELDRRLAARLDRQLAGGFADEVRSLASGPGWSRTAGQAIGYAEMLAHQHGEMGLDEARQLILRRLRRFARRQEAWFRRDPRVQWFDATAPTLSEDVEAFWDAKSGRNVTGACETAGR